MSAGFSPEITDAIAALATTPITLISPTVIGEEATVDSNFDGIAANGQALTFNGVGSRDFDACGLYANGDLVYVGS